MQTSNWNEVGNKVVALVESFSLICGTPPIHTYFRAIPDFWWVGIKLTFWLLDLLLAITCVKYSNGSCEPIFNIYISRAFHWYKELFDPISFDPLKYLFENSGLHKDSNSQNRSPFGNVWIHTLTFPRMQMWLLGCTLSLHLSMPLPWLWTQG